MNKQKLAFSLSWREKVDFKSTKTTVMRLKKIISVCIAAMLLSMIAVAQSSKKAAKGSALEVSFNYQRQEVSQ